MCSRNVGLDVLCLADRNLLFRLWVFNTWICSFFNLVKRMTELNLTTGDLESSVPQIVNSSIQTWLDFNCTLAHKPQSCSNYLDGNCFWACTSSTEMKSNPETLVTCGIWATLVAMRTKFKTRLYETPTGASQC